MDLDSMWSQFVKYRPMLDEMHEEWSKKNEEKLQARKTMDGRVLTEDEVRANDQGPQPTGAAVATTGATPDQGEPLEAGSEEELDRLREMAEKRNIDIDRRWHAKRLREELDMDEDEPVYAKAEEVPAPTTGAQPMEGTTASGDGGQANPIGPGHTASGSGGQDNPIRPGGEEDKEEEKLARSVPRQPVVNPGRRR